MNFNSFKAKYQKYPLLFSRDIYKDENTLQNDRNQLNRWVKSGLIVRLKRGVYLLNEQDRKIATDAGYIANNLYEPSYVSLEYALSFYGIIPEAVKDVTSVSTQKTMYIENELGNFVYQHIKPEAFRGFKNLKVGSLDVLIADPEKAIVDLVYLHLANFKSNVRGMFEEFYRFQNLNDLDAEKLMVFAAMFCSKKLKEVIEILCEMVDEEKND